MKIKRCFHKKLDNDIFEKIDYQKTRSVFEFPDRHMHQESDGLDVRIILRNYKELNIMYGDYIISETKNDITEIFNYGNCDHNGLQYDNYQWNDWFSIYDYWMW